MTPLDLKAIRERRERLFERTNPRVRPLEFAKDAWVLYAAYDLASFPALKPDANKPGVFKGHEEFFEYFKRFAAGKSRLLVVEEDHKYFRDKRGPVALVSVDNYGWRIEPQIDFFHWATPRERLAAAVCVLNVIRYSKEVGACVVRVGEKDEGFCQHLRDQYGLLQFVGKVDYGRPDGDEFQYCVRMKHAKAKAAEMKRAA